MKSMKSMTLDEITTVLADHAAWLAGDPSKGKRADLSWADLSESDLREANLRQANLSRADLHGVDLREADLRGATLRGANLRRADLRRADLYLADLSESDLREADLSWANLRLANLRWAYLRGADLHRADLSEADLRGANHVIALGQPHGWWAYAYLWESAIWVRVGCRTFSIAEGRAYWANKDERREVLAALDYAETIAKLRGWEFE